MGAFKCEKCKKEFTRIGKLTSSTLKLKGHELYMLGISNTQNPMTKLSKQRGDMIEINDIHQKSSSHENIIRLWKIFSEDNESA